MACYLSRSTDFIRFRLSKSAFSKRGEFVDSKVPAQVLDFDDQFSRLYGYVSHNAAEADRPLILNRLLDRIAEFSDTEDWDKFLEEQEETDRNRG